MSANLLEYKSHPSFPYSISLFINTLIVFLKILNLFHNLAEHLGAILRRITVFNQANLDIKFKLVSNILIVRQDFWCVKLKSIALGLVLIPVIFYTYNGVIGKSPDWINIAIFFISAAIAYIYEVRQLGKEMPCKHPKLALALLCFIATLFVIFTFATPELGIFKDPLSGAYGV